jgi:hypothetical protein
VSGVVHHVISRFVDRSWQLAGDDERQEYLARLGHALSRSDWTLLGYALMSSHIHLVLESGDGSLEAWTKSVHSGMARWLNRRHSRLGPVFADRPYAEAVDATRVPHVLAYVHNNPVRAKLATWAGDSAWTSHRAYLGLACHSATLCVPRGLALSGYEADDEGRLAFDDWVRACSGAQVLPTRDMVRRAWRAARETGGAVLELATPQITIDGPRFAVLAPRGAPVDRRRIDVTAHAVLAAVYGLSGTDPRGKSARDHRPIVARSRRAALRVWELAGRPRIEMARALGIGASAACRLAHARPERTPHELVRRVREQLGL